MTAFAERQKRIESYGHAHARLVEALQQFPKEMWHYRASADGWTIHEIVVHITDSEANSFIRCRRAIAEPGSAVLGYDEMQWARALRYGEQNTDDALELFKWLRGNTYKLVRSLPEGAWSNIIQHSESGPMTLDMWLDVYERHVPEHVAQMEAVFDVWRKSIKR
jgi:uncharacterized damage-inducible protein DinB